jgi:hypothetical protein
MRERGHRNARRLHSRFRFRNRRAASIESVRIVLRFATASDAVHRARTEVAEFLSHSRQTEETGARRFGYAGRAAIQHAEAKETEAARGRKVRHRGARVTALRAVSGESREGRSTRRPRG